MPAAQAHQDLCCIIIYIGYQPQALTALSVWGRACEEYFPPALGPRRDYCPRASMVIIG